MSGDLRCPFCLWPIRSDEERRSCADCSSVYHDECWVENRGCGTFGCPSWTHAQTNPGGAVPPPPPAVAGNVAVATHEPRFCDQCGTSIVASDRFCGVCGAVLQE